MTYNPSDPMNQFSGKPRNFGKVVREAELKAKRDKSEHSEQLTFCKWLKHEYPDVLFRSDIQSAGKLSPQMQNIKQIIDPYSGWPDVTIYLPEMPNRVGIMIEMKSTTAKLSGQHYRDQVAMHQRLEKLGWDVYVCMGAEEARRVFLEYLERRV